MNRPIKVLIAKPGLDGHDRGAKVIANALRDAGMEVVYTGLHQTPEMVVDAALQEDVDVVSVSILSGAHMTLIPRVRELMNQRGLADVNLIAGGIIPDADAHTLKKLPGVEVSEIRSSKAEVRGKDVFVTSTDANLAKTVGTTWSAGDDSVPGALGANGVIVLDRYATDHSLTLGSPVQLKTPTGKVLHLQVEGILDPPKGGSPFGEVSVSTAVFTKIPAGSRTLSRAARSRLGTWRSRDAMRRARSVGAAWSNSVCDARLAEIRSA